jgi:hypothetical protein
MWVRPGAYPKVEHMKAGFTWVDYPQELNWAGKACQRLQNDTKIHKLSVKSFITFDPGERKWEKLVKSNQSHFA